jgi:glutamine transport system substrate-binding protein
MKFRERASIKAAAASGLLLLSLLLPVSIPGAAAEKKVNELIVGCDTGFRPFVFIGSGGSFTGFEVELWRIIAERQGLTYRLIRMDFSSLIPALVDKKIDVALGGITISAEREQIIDFSYPHFHSSLRLLVRMSDESIADIGDLVDKVVATKDGTTSATFIGNIQTRSVSLFPTIDAAYKALQKRKADAVVFDSPAIADYIQTAGRYIAKTVGRVHQRQSYGIAFQQKSALREKVNVEILRLEQEGRLDILFREWFGYVPQ